KLTTYQKEWLDLCRTNSRLCLTAFRSSGKTEVLLVDDTIHWAYTHPSSQQLMISNTLPQATELLRRIKDNISTSEMLRTSIDSRYWTKTDITLKNKARILCKPYNENVRMLHVDRVKCDEMGEYRDHAVLKGAVFPTLTAKGGTFVGVGTPKSEMDLLHYLDTDPTFKALIYPVWTKDGTNLFKERYPNYEVRKKAGMYIIWDKVNNQERKMFTLSGGNYREPLTESQGEERARESLEDGEIWKMSVESGNTTEGLNDWVEYVLSVDGWEHTLGDIEDFGEHNGETIYLQLSSCGQHKEEIEDISFNGETDADKSLYTVLNVSFPAMEMADMLLFNL
ncbi:hypothetical protein LCGC14_3139640, partial [marine sediment metagenome]